MTSISWTNTSGGNWSDGSNWSTGVEPGMADDVILGGTAGYVVTLDVADAIHSLTMSDANATFEVEQALSVTTTLAVNNSALLLDNDGSITGGTVIVASGGYFQADGTLNDVAVHGNMQVQANNTGNYLTLENGCTFAGANGSGQGTINFSAGNGDNSTLYADGNTTLSNVVINVGVGNGASGGPDYIYNNDTSGNGATLTLNSSVTIDQTGQNVSVVSSHDATDAIINKGFINANFAGGTFFIDAADFTNAGTIDVSDGDNMVLTGAISAALISSISVTNGGYVNIDGTVTGGTLTSTGGVGSGDTQSTTGGALVNVAVQGILDVISGVSANFSFNLYGNTTFAGLGGNNAGTINFGVGSNSTNYLYAHGNFTLNNAVLNIGDDGINGGGNFLYNEDTGSGNATLTLGSGLTINQTNYYAGILSSDATGDAIINDGTINANLYDSSAPGGTDGLFVIDASHFTNNGTINVSGGDYLDLTGNISAALIDSINVTSGGYIAIAGTVTGGTLVTAGDIGSAYFFNNYQNPQDGYVYNQTGGVLSGVAVHGDLNINGGPGNGGTTSFTLTGATTFAGSNGSGLGTISFAGGDYSNSYLYAQGSYTLNNAVLNIGGDGNNGGTNFLYNQDTGSGNATLTLGANLTINQTNFSAGILSSDASGDSIVNDGTINANFYNSNPPNNYTTGLFTIDATHFINNGTINVSGGDVLDLTGSISASLIDSINVASDGYVGIAGTVTGGTLTTAGNVGGAYDGSSRGYTYNSTSGTLVGVAVHGTLNIPNGGDTNGVSVSLSFSLAGNTTFAGLAGGSSTGTINFGHGDNSNCYLYTQGSYTLNNVVLNIGADDVNGATNYLVNQDMGSTNATLTLGTSVTINQTNVSAGISGTANTGDAVINNGIINADYSDGFFSIDPLKFTNNGTLSVSNAETLSLSTNFTNFSNRTLTGGTVIVGQNGTFELNNNQNIVTLAANLTLSGTGSTLESYNSAAGTQTTFDSTFATLSTKGTLSLLAGRNLAATSKIIDFGTLALGNATLTASSGIALDSTGNLDGYGTVAGNITDSGTISASGGTLIIAGVLTGTGTLGAAAGGTVDLTTGGALGELIQGAGTLQLDGTPAYTLAGQTVVLGAISVDSGATLSGSGALQAALTDVGTLAATSGTLLVAGAISGAGALTAAAGTVLDLAGGGSIAGTVSGAGTLQLDGTGTLALNGTSLKIAAVDVDAGATLGFSRGGALSGTVTGAGTIQLSGATPYTLGGGTQTIGAVKLLAGAKLSGTGTLTGALAEAGTLIATAGTLAIEGAVSGAGTVQAASGALLAFLGGGSVTGPISGAGTLSIGGTAPFAITGATVSVAHLTIGAGATLSGTGTMSSVTTDTGTLTAAGGSLSVTGALSGTGALVAGTSAVLDLFGGDALTEAISGGGLLKLDTGTYTLAGGAIGTGSLAIDAGATLSGYGSVAGSTALGGIASASGGTLSFAGMSGTGSLSAGAGATVSLGAGGALTEHIFGAGTLALGGGTYTLAGATIGTGTDQLASGATLSGSGTLSGSVADAGTIAASGGTLYIAGALSGGGSLSVASGALLDLAGGGAIGTASGAGTLQLDSAGYTLSGGIATASLAVDAGATLSGTGTITATTADAGAIAASTGTLLLSGAVSGAGSLSAASGAVLDLAVGGSLTEAVSGAGTLVLGGGTSTLGTLGLSVATVGIGAGAMLSGTGTLSGALQNAGTLSATSGTLSIGGAVSGAGSLVTASGATLDFLAGGSFAGTSSGAGTLKLDGSSAYTLAAANVTDSTLLVDAGVSLSGAGTITSAITNAGTIVASGGTLKMTGAITGAGLLQAGSGADLDLTEGGTLTNAFSGAGTLELGGATVLGATLPSTATILIDAGASLSGTGTLAAIIADAGNLTATSGTLRLTKAVTGAGTLSAGTGATLNVSGGGTLSGTIGGAGTVDISYGTALAGNVALSAGHILVTTTVTTLANAHITQAAGSVVTLSTASGTAKTFGGNTATSYSNAGTLLSSGAGTFTENTATFANAGLVSVSAGTLSFLGTVTNSGTLLAGSGVLSLAKSLAGTGSLEIGATGIAALGNGAAAGQIVDFMAGTGALNLTNPTAFAGTIDGFAGSDTIDLVNTAETGFSYAGNVLSVTNGSTTVAALTFGGSYTQQDFTLASDGHGGSVITFV